MLLFSNSILFWSLDNKAIHTIQLFILLKVKVALSDSSQLQRLNQRVKATISSNQERKSIHQPHLIVLQLFCHSNLFMFCFITISFTFILVSYTISMIQQTYGPLQVHLVPIVLSLVIKLTLVKCGNGGTKNKKNILITQCSSFTLCAAQWPVDTCRL